MNWKSPERHRGCQPEHSQARASHLVANHLHFWPNLRTQWDRELCTWRGPERLGQTPPHPGLTRAELGFWTGNAKTKWVLMLPEHTVSGFKKIGTKSYLMDDWDLFRVFFFFFTIFEKKMYPKKGSH